jgi:hypothetical protein
MVKISKLIRYCRAILGLGVQTLAWQGVQALAWQGVQALAWQESKL